MTDSNNNIDNKIFYDKNLSFFDSISCEANEKNSKAKNWKEERKLNVETFGFSNNRNNNLNKRSNYNNYNSYSNYGNNMQRPQSYSNRSSGRGYSNGYNSSQQQQQQQQQDSRSTRVPVDTGYGRNSGNSRRYGSTR